ncbi:MAG: DMT family transporter [Bacteroidota bacterium]
MSKGVLYMLGATLLFAIMNVLVKSISNIPAVEVVFFRSVVSFIISFGTLKAAGLQVFGSRKNRWLLILRGASGAIALVMYFYLLQVIPLATAVVLQFLTPILTSLFGIVIAKEKVHPVQWIFFALAFTGVILVQGFDARVTLFHLVIGILAALFAGLAYNFIRKIGKSENSLVIILYFPLITAPLTGGYTLFNWVEPQGWEWFILLLIGLLTQFAQYFMTKSYQSDELSKVSSVNYTGIIYGLAFGWLFFDEQFNFLTYAGMSLVLIGVILNVWFKNSQKKRTV